MITLWGRATSVNVQPVMWIAGELGLEIDRIDAGGAFGGLDTPEFLAMNPNGLIPAMRDGDLTLFESTAIVRYLAASHGDGDLWPNHPRDRAKADQWADWTQATLYQPLIPGLFMSLILAPAAQRDMAAMAAHEAKLFKGMAIADAALARSEFIAGDAFTYADVIFGCLLYRYFTLPLPTRPETPNLQRYYGALTARPAYAAHVMIDYSAMKVPGA